MKNNKILILLCSILLTACGGGGGGGGGGNGGSSIGNSSSSDNILAPSVILPQIDMLSSNGQLIKNKEGNIVFNNSSNKILSNHGANAIGVKSKGNIFLKNDETIFIKDTSTNNENKNSKDYDLTNYSFGIFSKVTSPSKDIEIKNDGKIKLSGDSAVGIYGEKVIIHNTGYILGKGNNLIGIIGVDGNKSGLADSIVIQNNLINLEGNKKAIGIYLKDTTGNNNGNIIIKSPNGIGMYVSGKGSAINNGEINIWGNGIGMYAAYEGVAKNFGTINIHEKGYGMYAENGGYIINEGEIILSSQANAAMVANGRDSIIDNSGTIIVDSKNTSIKGKELLALNGGVIENGGKIIYTDDATISTKDGVYRIKTTRNGDYGKIEAQTLTIDGNILVDDEITKGSYKNRYILEKAFDASTIVPINCVVLSESLLYDAKLTEKSIELVKNKAISDLVDGEYKKTAKVFDKYFLEDYYKTLNERDKNLINSINTKDISILKENIKDLTPTLYANNKELIGNIENIFENQKDGNISSMRNYDYNISLIEEYGKTKSKNIIEGYKSQTTGFLGSIKLKNDSYLSLGYGYTDTDYKDDSDGKINSLYLGIDNYIKYNSFNLQYGVDTQYNFHKVERKMKSFDSVGNSKFNSYGLSAYGKISKTYTDIFEVEPYFLLDLSYHHIDDFKEKSLTDINIKKEKYKNIKPEIGFNISKKYDNLNFYVGINYSYEFGDTDSIVKYSYDINNQNIEIKDKGKNGNITNKIGVNYQKNNLTFQLEGRKTFGKRENLVGQIGIGYRF